MGSVEESRRGGKTTRMHSLEGVRVFCLCDGEEGLVGGTGVSKSNKKQSHK